MSLTVLPRSWSALCEPLLTAIDERRNLTLAGLYGPAKGLVLAALASSRAAAGPPLLVVVPNQDLADEQHLRARRPPPENPAENLRPPGQRRRHPGPARHQKLPRHQGSGIVA